MLGGHRLTGGTQDAGRNPTRAELGLGVPPFAVLTLDALLPQVYLFAEALAEGAVKMGMPGSLASRIAAQTLLVSRCCHLGTPSIAPLSPAPQLPPGLGTPSPSLPWALQHPAGWQSEGGGTGWPLASVSPLETKDEATRRQERAQ